MWFANQKHGSDRPAEPNKWFKHAGKTQTLVREPDNGSHRPVEPQAWFANQKPGSKRAGWAKNSVCQPKKWFNMGLAEPKIWFANPFWFAGRIRTLLAEPRRFRQKAASVRQQLQGIGRIPPPPGRQRWPPHKQQHCFFSGRHYWANGALRTLAQTWVPSSRAASLSWAWVLFRFELWLLGPQVLDIGACVASAPPPRLVLANI